MEYVTFENWELIRSVLGVLICLVLVLYIKQSRPDFNKNLANELSSKKYRKIKKQLDRLKVENKRTNQLLAQINYISPGLGGEESEIKKPAKANTGHEKVGTAAIETKPAALNKTHEKEICKPNNPYEQVRIYVSSGMSKEEIYKKMDIPQAEIDLMLKFNQMTRVSQLKTKTQEPLRAYG